MLFLNTFLTHSWQPWEMNISKLCRYMYGHMMSLVKKTKNNLLTFCYYRKKNEKFTLVSIVSIGRSYFVVCLCHSIHSSNILSKDYKIFYFVVHFNNRWRICDKFCKWFSFLIPFKSVVYRIDKLHFWSGIR